VARSSERSPVGGRKNSLSGGLLDSSVCLPILPSRSLYRGIFLQPLCLVTGFARFWSSMSSFSGGLAWGGGYCPHRSVRTVLKRGVPKRWGRSRCWDPKGEEGVCGRRNPDRTSGRAASMEFGGGIGQGSIDRKNTSGRPGGESRRSSVDRLDGSSRQNGSRGRNGVDKQGIEFTSAARTSTVPQRAQRGKA
jgi:hypothetical protein